MDTKKDTITLHIKLTQPTYTLWEEFTQSLMNITQESKPKKATLKDVTKSIEQTLEQDVLKDFMKGFKTNGFKN